MDERKKLQNQKKNTVRNITLVIFVLVLVVCDVMLIAKHGRPFSQRENRVLQQAPELSLSSLVSGKYMTDAEDFISDQFFARDWWISYKLNADKLLGKKESNGIYLGKNGYLIEKAAEEREPNFTENLSAIAAFASFTEALISPMCSEALSVTACAVCCASLSAAGRTAPSTALLTALCTPLLMASFNALSNSPMGVPPLHGCVGAVPLDSENLSLFSQVTRQGGRTFGFLRAARG